MKTRPHRFALRIWWADGHVTTADHRSWLGAWISAKLSSPWASAIYLEDRHRRKTHALKLD